MAIWEYKIISSGKGGFATPALLESFLNQIGTEEWEIIEFRTQPDNPLAFHGLARRPTQRDWTLEAAAAAAARAEADKLRAEFAAKFQAATSGPAEPVSETGPQGESPLRDDSFRRPRDTEHDLDPYALDDSAEEEVTDWPEEDQLPTFFEAIRPHMRRNQKGPGYSVGLEFLIKKFDMIENDLLVALKECGFAIPEDEDDKPVYLEYDGDLYWLNVNRRGELWINAREKPRPVFRSTKGNPVVPEEQPSEAVQAPERKGKGKQERQPRQVQQPKPEPEADARASVPAAESAKTESDNSQAPAQPSQKPEAVPGEPLPSGSQLLAKLRPLMRRSRGGWAGTISFLSRALYCSDAELVAALATLGLVTQSASEKAPVIEMEGHAYWLNRDGRGGIWINARDARRMRSEGRSAELPKEGADAAVEGGKPAADTPVVIAITPLDSQNGAPSAEVHAVAVAAAVSALDSESRSKQSIRRESQLPSDATAAAVASATLPLAGVRLLLKEIKPGSFAMEVGALSRQLERNEDDFLSVLVAAGLKIPQKARERPVFVEHAGEIFWLNRNSKDELWLNAKESKFSAKKESTPSAEPSDRDEKKQPRRATRGGRKPREK
ncbi:MAG: hypothetical protein WC378_00685 [Opitutaceae bacterium]|jgi:hypothetical protein